MLIIRIRDNTNILATTTGSRKQYYIVNGPSGS